jgi:1-acyl-sn-glycerol-3-phosphate acyltransferase
MYTLLLGVPAILVMLVVPNGDPLLWFARPWAWLLARSFGTRVTSSGMEKLPRNSSCVYMCNHQSHFDLVALLLALPGQYRIIGKRSLFRIPVFGWALSLAGFIPIDRGDRERAIASVNRAAEVVGRGRSVVVFAEGSRSPDGRLQPIKKGGFHLAIGAGAPIVPVTIRGGVDILPRGTLRIRPGTMEVIASDPIPTEGLSLEEMDRLIESVRVALQSGLDPPPAAAPPPGGRPVGASDARG